MMTLKRRGPPRTETSMAIIGMALEGQSPGQIALNVQTTLGAVMCVLTRARKSGIVIDYRKRGPKTSPLAA